MAIQFADIGKTSHWEVVARPHRRLANKLTPHEIDAEVMPLTA